MNEKIERFLIKFFKVKEVTTIKYLSGKGKKMPYVNSPCTQKCHINPDLGYCTGCFRTLREIAEWQKADHKEALDILTNTNIRRRRVCHQEKALTELKKEDHLNLKENKYGKRL